MAEPRFDVLFAGELRGAAGVGHVKQRLGALFKLDPSGVERLFTGHPVYIKRDVDQATAEKFRAAFHQAGAVAQLVAVPSEPPPPHCATPEAPEQSWSLAPPGANLEELTDQAPLRHPDTSTLSLVEGHDWSLDDCAPLPLAEPIADLDALALEPISESPNTTKPE